MLRKLSPAFLRNTMSYWPPFFGAGIRVKEISDDWRRATVTMPLRWYNKNYFGTQFGGNLFAMTDPFYILLVVNRLGSRYWVWDHSSKIEFLRPGRTRVWAHFEVDDETIDVLKANTASGEKWLHTLTVDITDESNKVVARVHKTLYVRLKTPPLSDETVSPNSKNQTE